MRQILYLHGFGSSPLSRKAAAFAQLCQERGWSFRGPDLNPPDFLEWRPGATLERVAAELAAMRAAAPGVPSWLVGSSFGGYLAALLAARESGASVAGLVLLAPAFGFCRLLHRSLGEAALARWQTTGSTAFTHHAQEREVAVGYVFYQDIRRWPAEPGPVSCPALVLHGAQDDVVPIAHARSWVAAQPRARLVEVPDDHTLAASLDRIVDLAAGWIARDDDPARTAQEGPAG